MKSLIIGLSLLVFSVSPVKAQDVFDSAFATSSASPSASPSATPRAVAYLDTSDTPESGTIENTIALLMGGSLLIVVGIKLQRA